VTAHVMSKKKEKENRYT